MKFVILILGLGSIGSRHARNLASLGHEVFGYDTEDVDVFRGPWGIKKVEPGKLEEIADIVDGCIIATPTESHVSDLTLALNHGLRTFIEKPIGDHISETLLKDIEYAKEAHIALMMGNNLRFHPSARLTKRYINEGLIGNPIWAHVACGQFNNRPQYLRDGVTLNWGAHEVDLALWLLGPAEVATSSINKEDTIADICLLHESGCHSVVHLDYLTDPELRQTVIIGDKGRLVLSLPNRYVVLQHGRSGPPEQQKGSWDEDYLNEMIAFVNTVQGKPWPGATAEDGLETVRIIEAAKKSAGL